jgi:hypothetical protein
MARVIGSALRGPPVAATEGLPDAAGLPEAAGLPDVDPTAGADVAVAWLEGAALEGAALVGEVLTEAGAALTDVVGGAACELLLDPQPDAARATATIRASGGSVRDGDLPVRGKGTDLLERSYGARRSGQPRRILQRCVLAVRRPAEPSPNPHEP